MNKKETICVVNAFEKGALAGVLRATMKYGGKILFSLKPENWAKKVVPLKEGQVVVVSTTDLVRGDTFWRAVSGRLPRPEDDLQLESEMGELGIKRFCHLPNLNEFEEADKTETIGKVTFFNRQGHRGPFVGLKVTKRWGKMTISLDPKMWVDRTLPRDNNQIVVLRIDDEYLIRNTAFWETLSGRLFRPEDERRFVDEMTELGIKRLHHD